MQQRINYLDTIRFVAMTLMVICHACDPFNAGATYGAGEVDEDMFLWGSVWGSCVRACVPLFVMLTGVLCLDTDLPMFTFWRRRIGRVLWPFLIWATIYNLFPWIVGLLGQPETVVYDFFVWASNPSPQLAVCLRRVAEIPFCFDNLACHLWYVYLLIGLYLFTPILAAWLRGATRREVEMVLALWLASTWLPYMREFVAHYVFGECEWNEFGMFYYFSGFAGYMLLGHYVVRYVPMRVMSTVSFAVPAFVVGAVVTWLGFRYMTALPSPTPEQTELFWYYCSPNVVLMTIALFLVVRLIPTSGWVARALENFTLCGFGIYLVHYFFIGPTYKLVEQMHLHNGVRVPLAAAMTVAASWALIAAVKRYCKHTQWLIG